MMFPVNQSPNKISDDTLELFKTVLENDLRNYGIQLAREKGLDENSVLSLIPGILEIPILQKINERYLDTSNMKYRKELNKYSVADLKEICRQKELKITGNREELIERISENIGLRDPSNEELEKSKSFKSKPLKMRKKTRGNVDLDETPNHYVSDSD